MGLGLRKTLSELSSRDCLGIPWKTLLTGLPVWDLAQHSAWTASALGHLWMTVRGDRLTSQLPEAVRLAEAGSGALKTSNWRRRGLWGALKGCGNVSGRQRTTHEGGRAMCMLRKDREVSGSLSSADLEAVCEQEGHPSARPQTPGDAGSGHVRKSGQSLVDC